MDFVCRNRFQLFLQTVAEAPASEAEEKAGSEQPKIIYRESVAGLLSAKAEKATNGNTRPVIQGR